MYIYTHTRANRLRALVQAVEVHEDLVKTAVNVYIYRYIYIYIYIYTHTC